ncbi:MAG: Hsp20 family protein [Proteobacteria bacterium]|nr:Hsp20 family protein [Pseudomonadota bacterium]
MQTSDVTPLFRTAQTLDRIWDGLNTSIGFDHRGYPEYDLLQTGDNEFRITLAVPGFLQSEIEVETRERALWVRGRKAVDPNHNQYLHQGIRERQFERSFHLPEHVQVSGASLKYGLLHIDLVREIPEELQPRRIEIEVERQAIEDQSIQAA